MPTLEQGYVEGPAEREKWAMDVEPIAVEGGGGYAQTEI